MNKDLIGIINSYFSKDLVMNKFPNVEKFDLIYNDPIEYYRGMPYPEYMLGCTKWTSRALPRTR